MPPISSPSPPKILLAPDKFRGTASASELCAAMASVAGELGMTTTEIAIADGGEGLLEALGGAPQHSIVTGPLGDPVMAEWRLIADGDRRTGVIEMARASGMRALEPGVTNDPWSATTYGTGELIIAALERGATEIIIGCGGSATTDGGMGALAAIGTALDDHRVPILVACDVTTTYIDAAAVFSPQKGADPEMVRQLQQRLIALQIQIHHDFGIDLASVPRSGAAGGLAGALKLVGGELVSGVALVADRLGLDRAIDSCDLVITGEGRFDATSLEGKVVGELLARAGTRPTAVLVGTADRSLDHAKYPNARLYSLAERFGSDLALHATLDLVATVSREFLINYRDRGGL